MDDTKNPTTTIKVFTKDRDRMAKLFGQPTHLAFNKVIILCPHPETERTYTTALVDALIPLDGDVRPKNAMKIHGFRCGACGHYVFQDPDAE